MNGNAQHCHPSALGRSNAKTRECKAKEGGGGEGVGEDVCFLTTDSPKKMGAFGRPCFLTWSLRDIAGVPRHHPLPCAFALSLLFFMAVEYTLRMIPPSAPPFDVGFVLTQRFHRLLTRLPALNTLLAALNTAFVGMQTIYILWAWLVEGRPRATIAALFMFTCRGILGYSTQLPLPQGFLGSGVDFPVGNVSFFLFYSGHVAGSVIASIDMRRMHRYELAWLFDALNAMQMLRLLATRGHYTIDLAVGYGAGIFFDSLAGKYYEDSNRSAASSLTEQRPLHEKLLPADAMAAVQYK
ncbi:resistance to o-dinitrobenzene [Asimina triloba]